MNPERSEHGRFGHAGGRRKVIRYAAFGNSPETLGMSDAVVHPNARRTKGKTSTRSEDKDQPVLLFANVAIRTCRHEHSNDCLGRTATKRWASRHTAARHLRSKAEDDDDDGERQRKSFSEVIIGTPKPAHASRPRCPWIMWRHDVGRRTAHVQRIILWLPAHTRIGHASAEFQCDHHRGASGWSQAADYLACAL